MSFRDSSKADVERKKEWKQKINDLSAVFEFQAHQNEKKNVSGF